MPPPSSVYSVENFDPSPDEELVCSVCRCVFNDPVECPCRHVFCRTCIMNWLSRKPSCPICRKRVVRFDLRPVVPVITNMIAKLRINCPNMELGCPDMISLEGYDGHLKVCQYELVKCKYTKCKKRTIRAAISTHEKKECKYRLVRCQRDCKLLVSYYKVWNHDCVTELKKLLQARKRENETLKKQNSELQDKCKNLEDELREVKNRYTRPSFNSLNNYESGSSFSSPSLIQYSDSWSFTSESRSMSSDLDEYDSVREHQSNDNNDYESNTGHQRSLGGRVEMDSVFGIHLGSFEMNSTQHEEDDEGSDHSVEMLTSMMQTESNTQDDESGSNRSSLTGTTKRQEPDHITQRSDGNKKFSVTIRPIMFDASEPGPSGLHLSSSQHVDSQNPGATLEEARNTGAVDPSSANAQQKRKRTVPVKPDTTGTESDTEVTRRPTRKKSSKGISNARDKEDNENRKSQSASTTRQTSQNSSNMQGNSVENVNLHPSTEVSITLARPTRDLSSPPPDGSSNTRKSSQRQSRANTRTQSAINSQSDGLVPTLESQGASLRIPSLHAGLTTGWLVNSVNNENSDDSSPGMEARDSTSYAEDRSSMVQRRTERRRSSRDAMHLPQHGALWHVTEPMLPRTFLLLQRYARESDPDWEPGLESSSSVDSDQITENSSSLGESLWESESSYDVEVPERTWDLLMRYSEETSDDDQDWEPTSI